MCQVFKSLWNESENAKRSDATVVTHSWDDNMRAWSRIRLFVVISVGRKVVTACRLFILTYQSYMLTACRPILTYSGQGTKKRKVKPETHALIYTGDKPPKQIDGEEKLGLRPIQVIPKTARDKLNITSRINYAKIYDVEYDLKVLFMGHIAPPFQHHLLTDFEATWNAKEKGS
jgi:hypothetical protein